MQHATSDLTRPAGSGWRRRPPGFLRPVSPAAVAVTISLLIGGAGFADAATGGTFILGKANKETSTASLSNAKGTALALSAPVGKAPLAVNRNVLVKNLNAEYLGGLTATGLATGGEGITPLFTSPPLAVAPRVVAKTGKLPAGTYYVIATAQLYVAPGDRYGLCIIAKGSAPGHPYSEGGALQEGEFNAAETAAVKVAARDTLDEICSVNGTSGSSVATHAGIIAIRVLSSSHQ